MSEGSSSSIDFGSAIGFGVGVVTAILVAQAYVDAVSLYDRHDRYDQVDEEKWNLLRGVGVATYSFFWPISAIARKAFSSMSSDKSRAKK